MILEKEAIHAQRNLTFELAGDAKLTRNCSFNVDFRYNRGNDGALSGPVIDMSSLIADIGISSTIAIDIKPELFYFNFNGNTDGFFASTALSIKHRRIPLSVFIQGVLPLWTNFPGNSFKWNMGFVYIF